MKIADVYWEGRSQVHSRRGPSDERYTFQRGAQGAPDSPAPVYEVEDALYFDSHEAFSVDWTSFGEIAKRSQALEDPANGIQAMLNDMGYRAKQQLAKNLGLRADGKEDELEERLEPEVRKLQQDMEDISK